MSELEQMTKADLLEHAKALGVSPANNDMTKAELIEGIEQHEAEAGVEGQATTTATKDYMGRPLITPSVNSKDYLGRPTFSAVDYMGRQLLL
jgi:Rho termination factor, N-terminal domain